MHPCIPTYFTMRPCVASHGATDVAVDLVSTAAPILARAAATLINICVQTIRKNTCSIKITLVLVFADDFCFQKQS